MLENEYGAFVTPNMSCKLISKSEQDTPPSWYPEDLGKDLL